MTPEQFTYLSNAGFRASLIKVEDVDKKTQVVLTSNRPLWAQTASAAIGSALRRVWTCGFEEIHRAVTAINASEVEHLREGGEHGNQEGGAGPAQKA